MGLELDLVSKPFGPDSRGSSLWVYIHEKVQGDPLNIFAASLSELLFVSALAASALILPGRFFFIWIFIFSQKISYYFAYDQL